MNELGLKRCPFCGSYEIAIDEFELIPGVFQYSAFCSECKVGTAYVMTKEQALKDWNKRFDSNKARSDLV